MKICFWIALTSAKKMRFRDNLQLTRTIVSSCNNWNGKCSRARCCWIGSAQAKKTWLLSSRNCSVKSSLCKKFIMIRAVGRKLLRQRKIMTWIVIMWGRWLGNNNWLMCRRLTRWGIRRISKLLLLGLGICRWLCREVNMKHLLEDSPSLVWCKINCHTQLLR